MMFCRPPSSSIESGAETEAELLSKRGYQFGGADGVASIEFSKCKDPKEIDVFTLG